MSDRVTAGLDGEDTVVETRSGRMIVLRARRILFLPVPKSGCTSIKWQLAELAGISREHFRSTRSKEPTLALAIHDMDLWDDELRWTTYGPDERAAMLAEPGWLRLSVVRDPAARLWSAWQSKMLVQEPRFLTQFGEAPWFPHRVGSMDDVVAAFREFVRALDVPRGPHSTAPENSHWAPQHELLNGPEAIDLTYLGRAEDPAATFRVLQDHLGPDVVLPRDLPRENSTLIGYHPSVYDEASADVVARYYAADYADYGYPEPTGPFDPGGQVDQAWKERGEAMLPAVHQVAERHVRIAELLAMLRGAEWRAARAEQRVNRIVERREEALAEEKRTRRQARRSAPQTAPEPASESAEPAAGVQERAT